MSNPIDAITYEDEQNIKNWIRYTKNVECGPLPQILQYWNKNKRTLYRALGNQLKVSQEVEMPYDKAKLIDKLSDVYGYMNWTPRTDDFYSEGKVYVKNHIHNEFVEEFLRYIFETCTEREFRAVKNLFSYSVIITGKVPPISFYEVGFKFTSFRCTVKTGMKVIRTIQKVVRASGFPRFDLFDKWRNDINIASEKTHKVKVTLSIHPLDFMTMSDNHANWTSCMSWKNSGCYHAGTIEMMNSNCAAVAYLESPHPFETILDDDNTIIATNKTWRALVFIHKDIICVGKSYPYYNGNINEVVLRMTEDLVKNNLRWTYQYKHEQYLDEAGLADNFYLKRTWTRELDYYKRTNETPHRIYLYTQSMYNDIIEDSDEHYLCSRNWVPHTKKICISGPLTCICCGEIITHAEDINSYSDGGTELVCWDCKQHRKCAGCGTIHYRRKYHLKNTRHFFCSKDCATTSYLLTSTGSIVPEEGRNLSKDIFVFSNKEDLHNNFSNLDVLRNMSSYDVLTELRNRGISYMKIPRYVQRELGAGYRAYGIVNTTDRYSFYFSKDEERYQEIQNYCISLQRITQDMLEVVA